MEQLRSVALDVSCVASAVKTGPGRNHSFGKPGRRGGLFHCEVPIHPDTGRIVKAREGLLATAVPVPGLEVTVKLAKRDVVGALIAQGLGAQAPQREWPDRMVSNLYFGLTIPQPEPASHRRVGRPQLRDGSATNVVLRRDCPILSRRPLHTGRALVALSRNRRYPPSPQSLPRPDTSSKNRRASADGIWSGSGIALRLGRRKVCITGVHRPPLFAPM